MKKIVIPIGILIVVLISAVLIYTFGLSKYQKADLCNRLHSDSSYSVETWEGIQFHLPACWYMEELEEEGKISLEISNNFGADYQLAELTILEIVFEKDLSDYTFEETIQVGTKEYDQYNKESALIGGTVFIPTWEGASFYIESTIDYCSSCTSHNIILGSLDHHKPE